MTKNTIKNRHLVTKEIFEKVCKKELNNQNSFLAGWYPNDIIEGEVVGSMRPWTKEGRQHHNFTHDFYATLVWYKLWKIKRFEQKAWNLDKDIIKKISDNFKRLIDVAVDEIEDGFIDDERRGIGGNTGNVRDYLIKYDPTIISEYTAADYLFQNITNKKIENVLDFGSGIGRQAMHWGGDVNFFSIDAIQSLYLLQNRIYSILFPDRLVEYFVNRDACKKIDVSINEKKLYHLPTWQMDLIPDNSIDLIICVQVLNEIDEKTVRYVIEQFKRIAKNNCVLYVRDHENHYTPALNVRVGKILLDYGFEVVYRYQGLSSDLEGVPRVWCNTDFRSSFKKRLIKAIDYPNTYGKFYLKTFFKAIYYKLRDIGLPI